MNEKGTFTVVTAVTIQYLTRGIAQQRGSPINGKNYAQLSNNTTLTNTTFTIFESC